MYYSNPQIVYKKSKYLYSLSFFMGQHTSFRTHHSNGNISVLTSMYDSSSLTTGQVTSGNDIVAYLPLVGCQQHAGGSGGYICIMSPKALRIVCRTMVRKPETITLPGPSSLQSDCSSALRSTTSFVTGRFRTELAVLTLT